MPIDERAFALILLIAAATACATDEPQRLPDSAAETTSDGPPFPWTDEPGQVLANLQHAIRAMGLDRDSPRYGATLRSPRVRRLLDVRADRRDDYYVIELEDGAGSLVAIAAIYKDGTLMGVGPLEGAEEPVCRAPDLAAVSRLLSERYAAEDSHYFHTMPTSLRCASEPFWPLIAANSPAGRLYVDTRLNVYREAGDVPPKRTPAPGGPPLMLDEVAPLDRPYLATRDGTFRTLELIGSLRDAIE